MKAIFIQRIFILLAGLFITTNVYSAKPTKPVQNPSPEINKVVFESQKIGVYGVGLSTVNNVEIAGIAITNFTNVSDDYLEIPFSTELSTIITQPGSFNLILDSKEFSFYSNSAIPDPGNIGNCPCEQSWIDAINGEVSIGGLPLNARVDCNEVGADIAATIPVPQPENSNEESKQFIFGASFYGENHQDTSCSTYATGSRYNETLGSYWPFIEELVKINNITLDQQISCAQFLKANICKP